MSPLLLTGAILGGLVFFGFIIALMFRRVVAANEVHIIQTSKKTLSYGKDTPNGNVYYEWPSSLPIIGVTKVVHPVNIFKLSIDGYEAYDIGRVPFVVDLTAFFRISDTNLAAQRVSSFEELREQLIEIVKGAARTILATSDIEEIMEARGSFGDKFTNEVAAQLQGWGVNTVKNIELMDIRDSAEDNVISNIMEKKKSLIEKESRTEVAENLKQAKMKEIEAKREVDIQDQQAQEAVGLRTVEQEKAVALAREAKQQTVQEQARLTREKEMAVLQVQEVETAKINKEKEIVKAEELQKTKVIAAEADLQAAKHTAEADLELKRKESEGIELEGNARATAEKQMQVAKVASELALAEEIGENEGYQKYLVEIRKVEADEAIGVKQADALEAADIKIISNAGSATEGLNSLSDVFTSNGGQKVGAMLEGLANTPLGQSVLKNMGIEEEEKTVSTTKTKKHGKNTKKLNGANLENGSGH